jgi:hypothetical protein
MATQTTRNKVLASKDPDNARNYGVDWTDVLPDSVTLSTVVIVGTPGLTVDSGPSVTGSRGTARFSGGTIGSNYDVTFRATFSDGQTDDRTITIPVRTK